MNYYPGGLAPAGYVAAADKPGLYAASPYAAAIPSPYATPGAGIPAGMQRYAASTQPYAMVSQASPYTHSQQAAAYYASATAAGYPAHVPLSSLQTISSSNPQASYLSAGQYPVGFQTAGQLGPTSVAAAGYGGSPLYAASTPYAGIPAGAVPGQPASRAAAYGVAPIGYAAGAQIPSSPAYPGATGFGPPY